jgi:hypothetical protein
MKPVFFNLTIGLIVVSCFGGPSTSMRDKIWKRIWHIVWDLKLERTKIKKETEIPNIVSSCVDNTHTRICQK